MTSSNTFQSDIGSIQNGSYGPGRYNQGSLGIIYVLINFLLFYFFTDRPTDPLSRERGRWETKHFMGMAKCKTKGFVVLISLTQNSCVSCFLRFW